MACPILFFDIAAPDDGALKHFYSDLFSWDADGAGRFGVPVKMPLSGAFRRDPAEMRLYIGVRDVAATLARIVERGGSVDMARCEVSGMVVLGLFRDPAGNPMGLVEVDAECQLVIPQ